VVHREARQHPLPAEQSRSGHLLLPRSFSLFLLFPSSSRFDSLPPRFPSISHFQHPLRPPLSLTLSLSPPFSFLHLFVASTPYPSSSCRVAFFSLHLFVASFPSHHSLSAILRHLSVVLTSRSVALSSGIGRIHGTSSSLPTHDSTTLGYASSRYREYLYNLTTTIVDLRVSVYGTFRAGVVRTLRATRRETGSESEHRARSSIDRISGENLFLLSFSVSLSCLSSLDPSCCRHRRARFLGDFFLLRTNDASSRSSSDARFDPAGCYLSTGQPGGPLTRRDRP